MPRPSLAPLATLLLALGLAHPAAAQTDAEPPRKGLGGLLGKAADRLKEEAMKRFDKDGDGKLDDAERAEALEAMKKKGGEIQGQLRQFMLRRFDANGDGTLDQAERKTAFAETMKQLEENGPLVKNTVLGFVHQRFDTNGDGSLDGGELAVARAELTKRIIEGVAPSDAPTKPADPVARRKEAEEKRKRELLDRFDADGDGTLDESEREAAKAELKKRYDELDAAAADAPQKPAPNPR